MIFTLPSMPTTCGSKRATLIGERTGGGAHPGSAIRLNDHFGAIVPSGRSISPITHTDWKGVGVMPDVATDADDALSRARTMILANRLRTETDPGKRDRLQRRISESIERKGGEALGSVAFQCARAASLRLNRVLFGCSLLPIAVTG